MKHHTPASLLERGKGRCGSWHSLEQTLSPAASRYQPATWILPFLQVDPGFIKWGVTHSSRGRGICSTNQTINA